MILTFNIQKQKIKRTDFNYVVANSQNYLRARFTFSEEWIGNITAVFTYQNKTYNVLLSNAECLVPWEVIQPGEFSVSCFGDDLVTSDVVTVPVVPSGLLDGVPPAPPTPNIYDEILKTAQNAQQTAQSVRDDADNGAFTATAEVGSTTTLPPGSSAAVTNSGTDQHGVWNFSIPQGEKGDKGEPGSGGATQLEELTDVHVTNKANGQGLIYDAAIDMWVNGNIASDIQLSDIAQAGENITFDPGTLTKINATLPSNILLNTATGSNSLSILGSSVPYARITLAGVNSVYRGNNEGEGTAIGQGAVCVQYSTSLGSGATSGRASTALGRNSNASGDDAIAIGHNSSSSASHGIAIGGNYYNGLPAKVTQPNAIQIGQGTNSVANTLNVGISSSLNVRVLNADGTANDIRGKLASQSDIWSGTQAEFDALTDKPIIGLTTDTKVLYIRGIEIGQLS